MIESWNIFLRKWNSLWKNFFFSCYLPSLLCCLFVELCSRRSLINLALFILREPLVFLYNGLLIAATASLCLLFKRKIFVLSVVLLLWAGVGIVDLVLLSFRTTPFTAVDLALVKDALAIANRYLSWFGVVLIIAGTIAVLLLCVYLFRKAEKEEDTREYKIRIPFCGLLFLLCIMFTDIGTAAGLLDRNFGNLAQAFHDNGLAYCFMNSILNTGVEKPEDYSSEAMGNLLEEFEEEEGHELVTEFPKPTEPLPESTKVPEPTEIQEPTKAPEPEQPVITSIPEERPNIIFLQLESFFDVKYIENFACTEDPVPYFTYLRENYPGGFLEVPSIGAGTANTEFECITGMNLDLFGPGEYPYKTILKDRTCESLAYILKGMGYSSSAMHNNDGTFYNRHEVFSNLGFDRYIPVEYMAKAEVNELNWARDKVLTGQIMKVLSCTKEPDFIYAISVQGHGAYPEEELLPEKKLDIALPEELEEYYYQYLYYVHQLQEMDSFIKELVLNLSACREKVVLVLYGDHLPSLGLSEELLHNSNSFQTEYVIWSNFGLQAADKDIQSYQLSSRVLHLLGMEDGIMPQYHIYRQDEENYLENMHLLMYDMLYGDMEVYEGVNPYESTELQMGISEIRIQDVYMKKSPISEETLLLYLHGQNFTEWSVISINGETVETMFLNERLLAAAELPESEDGIYRITVRQQGKDEIVLSETEITEYTLR